MIRIPYRDALFVLAAAGSFLLANAGHAEPSSVTLYGTVQKVKNSQEFTVRNDHGVFEVQLTDNHAAILDEGDSISVTGSVDPSHRVSASVVEIHQRAGV